MPINISALSMTEGTAERSWNDHSKAGSKGGMHDYVRRKACSIKRPEEERDQDNPAADTEQTGQKTGEAAEKDKQQDGRNCKSSHDQSKTKQASLIKAGLFILEAPSGFEPLMEILQTSALPLGDGAIKKESL